MKKFTKRFISALLAIVMMLTTLSISVFAAEPTSGTCGDNLTWTFNTETSELTIEGTGAMYDYDYNNRPWESYEDSIKTVTIGNSVTAIGDNAFYWCSLTSVTIGDSVTTIGDHAFSGCTSLTSVTIPDSVTTIGNFAFTSCTALTNVTIPDSVTTIGDRTFDSCYILTSIEVDADNEYYSSDSFGVLYNKDKTELIHYPAGNARTEFTIPDSVTTIGEGAFRYCDGLTSVTIPDSVTTIGEGAFHSCDSLTSVTIPDSVTTIGDEAFAYCDSLTSVTIPDSVTTIEGWAFRDCDSLTSVTIPDSVTTIGGSAFYCCYSLTSIEVDADNEYYSSDLFGVLYNKDKTTLIQYPIGNERTEFTIPDSVTTIGDCAFAACTSLTSVTIPDSVTTIGDYAFRDCDSLTSVTIPDSVTTIGKYAFRDCNSLTSVTIPDSVTTIGKYAFAWCDSLTDVYYNGTEEDWNEIAIGSDNEPLLNATIHYNEVEDEDISGTCGESLTWTFDEETGELKIDGTGAMYNYNYDNRPWESYKYEIKTVTISYSVTAIGDYAFAYCDRLTSVIIPDSVTTIGDSVFTYCKGLKSVTIGNGVTEIGRAFNSCFSLTNIEVDNDNQHYSSDSFGVLYNKDKTELIKYPVGNKRVSFTIPDSVAIIGYQAFDSCDNLTSVTIPDSVITIGSWVFFECDGLTSVTIPDSVTTIGEYAFYGCNSLATVTIGNSVNTIGLAAFYECDSLANVTIPNSVTAIGASAFRFCDSLADIYYNGTEEDWNEIEVGQNNEPLLNATIHYNYGKPSGTLGENINWSFDEENGTLSITGSGEMLNLASVEDYGWYYFKDKIETAEFANGVTSVSDNAFFSYPNLKEVYLGQTVESIGENAFADCTALAIVTSDALNFTAKDSSFGNNDERFVLLHNASATQAADYVSEHGMKHIPVYYDSEKKVMSYDGELVVYSDLSYMFLSKFVKQNPDMEYLFFKKIVFYGIEPEIIDIEDLENDTFAQYLTFNNLYVSLKKVKDGSAEDITFEAFITLLENGDYDSFMFELISDEGTQQLTFIEILETVTDFFITNALRVTSKIVNFFRKMFK